LDTDERRTTEAVDHTVNTFRSELFFQQHPVVLSRDVTALTEHVVSKLRCDGSVFLLSTSLHCGEQ
jgi:hypothetical protein